MVRNDGIPSERSLPSKSYWSFTPQKTKMTKKKSVPSPQEKRTPASELFTTPLTEKQRRAVKKLAATPDSEIDFTDAPQAHWPPQEVHIGRFYGPIKQLVSLRLDADVLAWFRGRGKKYQTYMNDVLRREMQSGNTPQ